MAAKLLPQSRTLCGRQHQRDLLFGACKLHTSSTKSLLYQEEVLSMEALQYWIPAVFVWSPPRVLDLQVFVTTAHEVLHPIWTVEQSQQIRTCSGPTNIYNHHTTDHKAYKI